MIRSIPFSYGVVGGTRYIFERRGEGLPMHSHAPEGEHNVIVLRGAVAINGQLRVVAPALISDLPKRHEIAALVDGTEILNLFRRGKPEGWESEKPASESPRPLEFSIEAL